MGYPAVRGPDSNDENTSIFTMSKAVKYVKPFLIVFLVTLLLVTALLTYVRYTLRPGNDNPIFPGTDSPTIRDEIPHIIPPDSPIVEISESERVNILVLGVNQGLTDVIIVVSYDMQTSDIDMISIPRDTYYYRDGYSSAAFFKINSVYHTSGKNTKGENKDPVAIAKAVSETLQGLPIDFYAIVNFNSVRDIINAVGGVDFEVPQDMDYDDPYDTPPLSIHFKKGMHHFDGNDAVKLLRYRSGYYNGDIGRISVQQDFLKAMFRQVLSSNLNLVKVARIVLDNLESTDISWGFVSELVANIKNLSADSLSMYTMPNDPQLEDPWFVFPRPEEIVNLIKQIYNVQTPSAEEGTAQ